MLKQLFCKHEFKHIGNLNIDTVNIPLLECTKCKKRKALIEKYEAYFDSTLEMIDLWQKNQYEFENSDID